MQEIHDEDRKITNKVKKVSGTRNQNHQSLGFATGKIKVEIKIFKKLLL